MSYIQNQLKNIQFLLFLSLIISLFCCENDKGKENEPDLPDKENTDTNTVAELIDTICPDGILYDSDCYNDSVLAIWGMGDEELYYSGNDREYEWYIDQANTGAASENNCGPCCAAMATSWYDKNLAVTAEEARNMIPNDGGWWYTNNIIDFLNHYSVPNTIYAFSDCQQLIDFISDGNIIILCLTTALIRYNDESDERIDRFYGYADGHFLIVKGVRDVDTDTYFEVYDPNNWNALYDDNTEKGKNRHYRATDISNAISEWWKYLIVIYPDAGKSKSTESIYKKIVPSEIAHAWGR